MSALQIFSYISVTFFLAAVIAKMIRIARMPVHLRWELYPIPHEKGRSSYGGSYFEEVDWWTKKRSFSLVNEVKEMAKEIVFIHSVYKNNRTLWIFSFPFHIGMYCLIGFAALMVLGAITGTPGADPSVASQGSFPVILRYLTQTAGVVGWILSIVGAAGLLISRVSMGELRASTVLSDYVNLIFLLAVFSTGFIAWIADPACAAASGFIRSVLEFGPAAPLPAALSAHLWLGVGLLFYFPFTHMTHMVGKYFTYHKVRWEDEPNIRGSKIEHAVQTALGYNLTWSAPHIKSGSTWAEAATAPLKDKENE